MFCVILWSSYCNTAAHRYRINHIQFAHCLHQECVLHFIRMDVMIKIYLSSYMLQVCRQFFLKTLDVSEKASRIVLEKMVRGELGNETGGANTPPPTSSSARDREERRAAKSGGDMVVKEEDIKSEESWWGSRRPVSPSTCVHLSFHTTPVQFHPKYQAAWRRR